MKKILLAVLVTSFYFSAGYAQNYKLEDYEKTEHGIPYKTYIHGSGDKAKIGDWVEMNIQQVYNDSLLVDTRKLNAGKPVQLQLHPAQFDGDIPEGFTYMRPGDSTVFLISTDTLKKRVGTLPPLFKTGDFLEFRVAMVSVKSDDQMKKELKEKEEKQAAVDEKLLQEYFAKNNIKATKGATGFYYKIDKKGVGPMPKEGQKITVKYTGKLLSGTVFDSDVDSAFHHTSPLLSFLIGKHQVIPGWDQGMAFFNKGSKGTIYIPSTLAYGERGAGQAIPPNAILVFDVEIADIETPTTDEMITTPTPPNTNKTTPVNTKGRKMNVKKGN
jgi:FKBP-type peptidyl-prolyl cis-trans isomerase